MEIGTQQGNEGGLLTGMGFLLGGMKTLEDYGDCFTAQ